MLINLLIIASVIVVFLVGNFLLGGPGERKKTLARIERIKQRKVTTKTQEDVSLRRKNTELKGLISWLVKPLPDFRKLGDRLERAGITVTPKQFVLRCFLMLLLITLVVAFVMNKPFLLGLFLGIIFGVWLPFKVVQFKINRRSKAFLLLFPDALDLIVRGLRSGLPVSESLVMVSHEVPQPVGGIFATIANTMKLGVTLEKALQETARKLDMTEFNFFTTSIVLQRETGGNLSEVLNNLSEVLRNRIMMRMKIKAMSSEARASSYIIGALPFVVLGAVSVLSPDYIAPLKDDYRGNICAGIAAFMMISGMWVMNRMTKFEI